MASTIVTVRPNGGTLGTAWTNTGGASIQAVTSDDSDASYAGSSGSTQRYCSLTFPVVTLPALAIGVTVTPRWRISTAVAPTPNNQKFSVSLTGEAQWVDTINGSTTITTYAGSTRITRPGGGAWTQADLNALALQFHSVNGNPVLYWINTKVYEFYLDVGYNQAPVAAVTAPTGTLTISAPPVTWTYTDPESDVQERYQVKIFTAAQYGIGGFDPNTSPYTWSSGEVFSSATTVTPAPMGNATYRAYVKVADVGSSGRYSAWAFGGFVLNATLPPTPTLVATADAALSRVKLDTTVGTYASASQKVIVERSVDAGVTWVQVRGAFEIVTANLATFTVYDYEMPRGVSVSYRSRVVADPAGGRVVSVNSTTATVTLTPAGWWLKDPQYPGLNMLMRVAPDFTLRRKIPQKTYEGLGAVTATVVTDGAKGYEGSLTVWALTGERFAKLDALIDAARPLLLEDALGRAWYVQIGDDSDWALVHARPTATETSAIRHLHSVTLAWTETAVPSGVTQAAGTPTG